MRWLIGPIFESKRALAGEYSREFSAKVFAGQSRLIEKGFRQGGASGFGLRRAMIDENGTFKVILNRGERKSIQTDRVILRPGPADEIGIIDEIYESFVHDNRSESDIAEELNKRA